MHEVKFMNNNECEMMENNSPPYLSFHSFTL